MIRWPDLINAGFEVGSALVSVINVMALWKARRISGVHWAPTLFFTAWGLWNLFFYPHLGQWASLAGAVGIVGVNATWLAMVWWFSRGRA